MDSDIGKGSSKLFHVLCIFATVGLVSWCTYEYSLDHDFTEIKFRKFHEKPDDIYPSITICDKTPFHSTPAKERFLSYMKNLLINHKGEYNIFAASVQIKAYQEVLAGRNSVLKNSIESNHLNTTYEQLLLDFQAIDYDEVTTQLRDLISGFYITIPIDSQSVNNLEYHISNDDDLILSQTS